MNNLNTAQCKCHCHTKSTHFGWYMKNNGCACSVRSCEHCNHENFRSKDQCEKCRSSICAGDCDKPYVECEATQSPKEQYTCICDYNSKTKVRLDIVCPVHDWEVSGTIFYDQNKANKYIANEGLKLAEKHNK